MEVFGSLGLQGYESGLTRVRRITEDGALESSWVEAVKRRRGLVTALKDSHGFEVQGYLAHEKPPPSRTLQQDHA